ncbi:MAG: TIGR00374 family protein, partial [Actinomyces sp.]
MRKRKDSHDGSPVGDTNILFVPSSSADPSASGVDALMGMIDEAGAPPQTPAPPEVPSSEARTEVMEPVITPDASTAPVAMPPSIPPSHADADQGTPASSSNDESAADPLLPPPAPTTDDAATSPEEPADEAEDSAPEATTETDAEASTDDKDADIESAPSPATGEIAANLPVRRMRLPRPVYIADRILPMRRRREDLVDVVLSLIAILIIWTIGSVASATTHGVTMDVLQFQLIRKILILPVSLVEGLIILITPILVIVSLALRKRLQAIIQALVTSVVAAVGGWIIAFLTGLLPAYLTAPLSVDRAIATQGSQTGSVIAINLVIVTLCALFTSAGEAQSMKAIKWGWTGLWIILVLGVLRSSMTLPVAFISVFLGRAFGSGSRWVMGYDDQRAKGTKLVEGLLSIGITPSRIVRTDLDTTEEPLATWAVAENSRGHLTQMPADLGDMGVTVTRRPNQDYHRHYQAWSDTGLAYEIIAMDPGQELTGTLVEMWNNLRLRGISRWVSPSLKAQAERSSFTTLQALRAGVFTQEPIGIASSADSIIMVMSALPPTTPLTELGEDATDEVLD